jgi:hypothetical protein
MSDKNQPDETVRDPIATMETLLDDIAEQAADDYVPTDDDIRWASELGSVVEQRLAGLERRPRRPPQDQVRHDVIIPESIQRLDRESLLVQLELQRRNPNVQYAQRNLTTFSDDDLRRMLALLMQPPRR